MRLDECRIALARFQSGRAVETRNGLLATTDAANLRMKDSVQLGGICSGYSFWRHFHGLREQECPEDTDNACWFWTGRICHRESPRQLQPVYSSDLQRSKRELISDCPPRDEGDSKAAFHCAQQPFGRVQLH